MNLQPFTPVPDLNVDASVEHLGTRLRFTYRFTGSILDGPTPIPNDPSAWSRADELWRTTCFEAFWAVPGSPAYWELNLSPGSRRWNLYRFDEYRKPQPPKRVEDIDLSSITLNEDALSAELVAEKPWPTLDVALTSVIRTARGTHYFALRHGGDKPDFHRRADFTLEISPVVST